MTRKKIVWLPYDFDTALGINNEGALVFDYELEDTDHIEGGADVYNGQESVVWCNIRDAFGDELASMYQTLRSQGKLSYSAVEKAFEDHQDKWSEAIFNEDAWFKYIDPLINEGNGAYLEMLQGSKKEQRKWWLYNRFRYIDSKYNAGDALVDVIQLRGYAKANVTVIPYADIYPTVKYGSYLVHQRGKRGVATTLVNPLDSVNDTEIYIYSSSQLASVGDLSGLLVGFADFSMATKLQELKIGSDAVGYSNSNLKTLTLGNNVLLKKIDVRNCVGLGTGDQKSVDISGCTNIEEIYFDGTNITGLQLPNGGIIKKLHLPETITNLTVMNQKAVTEFVIPTYQNISTLRLENVSDAIDQIEILKQIPANSRVRLIGFYMLADDAQEIDQIFDILDTMRGLDEAGNNMDSAQVSGEIHTASLTGAEIAEFNQRYPYVRVTADHTSAVLTYKTYDGATTLFTETVLDGGDGTKVNTTARIADAQYTYEPDGWSLTQDGAKDVDALVGVTADRTVFASYTKTLRKYTVTWKNADNTTLETDTNVPYGSTPSYNGATPTYHGQTSTGWSPAVSTVVGDVTYTATYKPMYTATFVRASADGGGTLYTQNYVVEGTTPVYGGSTPTTTKGDATTYPFDGWTPALAPIYADTTYTAKFKSPVEDIEITDTWDQIIASIDDGTYATKYNLGNYKPLDLGDEGTVNMQIVGFNVDEDSEGYPAPITFVAKELLNTAVIMNPVYAPIYEYPLIPSWKRSDSGTTSTWSSQNRYNTSDAKITLTLVANEDVSAKFTYKVSNANNSRNTILVNDNGTQRTPTASTTAQVITIDLSANDTYVIEVIYSLKATYNYYGTLTLTNIDKFTITENIELAPDRITAGYKEGTGSVGGWRKSQMRKYLQNNIMSNIPSVVKDRMIPVRKYFSNVHSRINSEVTINDSVMDYIWIPSHKELFNETTFETQGCAYSMIYKDGTSRIKAPVASPSSPVAYWLRSASVYNLFRKVDTYGAKGGEAAETAQRPCIGFSLGVEAETIPDSWDTIIANVDPASDYKIGDTKWLTLSSGERVLMQIVGFNCDELADGNGVARISWISKYLLNDPHAINSEQTTSGGWQASGMRSYLNGTIKPMLPENIRNGIQTVKKYSSTYENGTLVKDGQTTNDDLWIPSHKEIFDSTIYETKSPSYSGIFTDSSSRKKARVSNVTAGINYWTRSTNNSSYKFMYVNYNGSNQNQDVTWQSGIALGFCTGANYDTILDSWSDVLKEVDATTKYQIGDTKSIDLGTEGIIQMQIVGFNTDELADGSGTARISWISKQLLETSHAMNSDGTTANGWEYSELRTYLKTDIYSLLPDIIKDNIRGVKKYSSTYVNGALVQDGQTTTDDLWIPSQREMFNTTTYETQGASYSTAFTNNEARMKGKISEQPVSKYYLLRSVEDGGSFGAVTNSGRSDYMNADSLGSIALGFCTGATVTGLTDTITDTWDEIFAAEDDGSYTTKYSIGDTKSIDLGTEGIVQMQIVGFNVDELADSSGTAKITWISKQLLKTGVNFNTTSIASLYQRGWEVSNLRIYLMANIAPKIQKKLRNHIKTVKKYSSTYYNSEQVVDGSVTNDYIWIPAHKEMLNDTTYESQGASYSTIFTDNNSRKKAKTLTPNTYGYYWLRSVKNYEVMCILDYGNASSYGVTNIYGIALGFCTGANTE